MCNKARNDFQTPADVVCIQCNDKTIETIQQFLTHHYTVIAFDAQHNYFMIQPRDSDARIAIFVRKGAKLT